MCARPRTGDLRKNQLLEATVEVVTERGFNDTRLEDIAARIGIHPSTVLHYVSSKNELLAQALEFAEQRFFTRLLEVLSHENGALAKLGVVVQWSSEPPGGVGDLALWLDVWSIARTTPEVHATRLRMDAAWREILEQIVRTGQERGELGGPPPADAALVIAALLDGLGIPMTLGNPAVSPQRMNAVACQAISSLLGCDLVASRPRERSVRSAPAARAKVRL